MWAASAYQLDACEVVSPISGGGGGGGGRDLTSFSRRCWIAVCESCRDSGSCIEMPPAPQRAAMDHVSKTYKHLNQDH